jgi:hypothetical protein
VYVGTVVSQVLAVPWHNPIANMDTYMRVDKNIGRRQEYLGWVASENSGGHD